MQVTIPTALHVEPRQHIIWHSINFRRSRDGVRGSTDRGALLIGQTLSPYRRSLDSPVARRLDAGEGQGLPFWSPDGPRIAFFSRDKQDLFVKAVGSASPEQPLYRSFPVTGHKVQVSTDGAVAASWTREGRHILFLGTDWQRLWRVDVEAGATPHLGTPKHTATLPGGLIGIDAMPDRQRRLARVAEREGIGSVTVVHNWRAALAKRRHAEP